MNKLGNLGAALVMLGASFGAQADEVQDEVLHEMLLTQNKLVYAKCVQDGLKPTMETLSTSIDEDIAAVQKKCKRLYGANISKYSK